MRYKQIILGLLITTLFFNIGCKNTNLEKDDVQINDVEKPEEIVEVDLISKQIKAMTIEEKIGQLIIVGFEGTNINEEAIKYIEDFKVGGFILFSRNIVDENQTLELLNDLKEANSNNDIPLFLSIDEEGGRVSRLPKSFVKLPEATNLGNKNDPNISYKFGQTLGERVKSLGFNMDFAPVLDINSNPKNPVIGTRSFGNTVEIVKNNGIEVMMGIKDTKVIPAAKHFPGHGDTSIDSHVNLPKVDKTMEKLKNFELIPFIAAIEKDIDIIMVAHILYSDIDQDQPATMSPKIIGGLLREELGYEGVVVSDDMTMGAIVENYTLEDGTLSFIKAGGDIALICHGNENPGKVLEKIKEAINTGELSEEYIDEKVYRILKLKAKYELEDNVIQEVDLKTLNHITEDLIKDILK